MDGILFKQNHPAINRQKHLHRKVSVFPAFDKNIKERSKFINNLKPLFPGYLLGTELKNIPWTSITN